MVKGMDLQTLKAIISLKRLLSFAVTLFANTYLKNLSPVKKEEDVIFFEIN